MMTENTELKSYDYDLPKELIAQHPLENRDDSKLLVYSRPTKQIEHRFFKELPDLLTKNDILVVNNCKVIPARLFATRRDTGTEIEILLIKKLGPVMWRAMVKPGRSCKRNVVLNIGSISAEIINIQKNGERDILFNCTGKEFQRLLNSYGVMPLPPYIKRPHQPSSPEDRERYQTVYANSGLGVAAPTAGLHFTEKLLQVIKNKGCKILSVTLNVGPGTFAPVKAENIKEHNIHSEEYELTDETAGELNEARKQGRKIIAVGTTSLRVLESCIDKTGVFNSGSGTTDIFIYPPYNIRSINALITNFHLPKSTLLMLIAAWVGMNNWRDIYTEAIKNKYRFYSYGDATFLT